ATIVLGFSARFAVGSTMAVPAATDLQSGSSPPPPRAQPPEENTALDPGQPIEEELSGAQTHLYRIALAEHRYANVVVEQRGVDVTLQLRDAAGKLLVEVDSESRLQGQERVAWVAESTGTYQLAVKAKYPRMAAGRY